MLVSMLLYEEFFITSTQQKIKQRKHFVKTCTTVYTPKHVRINTFVASEKKVILKCKVFQ